jgi:aspartyl protease
LNQILKVAVIVGLWSGVVAQAPKELSLQQLYERHSWFELRDAIAGRAVPALYAGAVASAFNRTRDAENLLKRAVRDASSSEAANDAREVLVNLYMRLGRSSDMIRLLDEAIATAPSRSDFRNVRQAFESFRRLPNQSARPGQHQRFRCDVSAEGVVLPAVINGKAVHWLFDSAFSHSAMSESEARMLGISVQGASAAAGDFAGRTAPMRTAVAERVAIGDAELRNVPVLVFPDSQPPFNEHAPGKRGAIGLPVALALQAIRWTKDGACQVGSNPIRTAGPDGNLAFDGATPLIRVQYSDRPLEFVLDTGNQGGTQLWERFARDFPDVVRAGRKSTKQVHQIGGSTEQQIVAIPELRLRVGGLDGVLRPANLFSPPIGNDLQHGNLGLDVLSQAAEVMIDFQAMLVTVR